MLKIRDPRHLQPLVALLVAAACSSPVFGCSSAKPQPSDLELFESAREVFVARVVETKLSILREPDCEPDPEDPDFCSYVSGTYELQKALKGAPPVHGLVSDAVMAIGNCSLGLVAGWYYVFYLGADDNFVLHPTGSFSLGPYFDEQEQKIVRTLEEPERERPKGEG